MVGVIGLVVAALLLAPIIGTAVGALVGGLVGLVFSDPILGMLSSVGIENVSMWQFGAFLGFVRGFFTSVKHNQ